MATEQTLVDEIPLGGFKYLKEKNKFVRSIWVTVILIFLFLTLYQIITQIVKYLEYEVATNIEVEYPQEIRFPTVAICNNNQFRMSYLASEEVRTRVPGDQRQPNKSALLMEQALDTMWDSPADSFLFHSASAFEDMIISCKFNLEDCKDRLLWKQIWTLEGLCWAFNYRPEQPLGTNQTGAEHGLRVLLNAETYENTLSCIDGGDKKFTSGFKVIVFNQTDAPLISTEGISVMPGYATKIPIRIKEREAYTSSGTCAPDDAGSLEAMSDPLSERNIRTCLSREYLNYFHDKCNCSIANLFKLDAETKTKCDVDQYFNCVLPLKETLHDVTSQLITSKCLPPCKRVDYIIEQDLSQLPEGILPHFQSFLLHSDIHDDSQFKKGYTMKRKILTGTHKNGTRIYEDANIACEESQYFNEDAAKKLREKYEIIMDIRVRDEDLEARKWRYVFFMYDNVMQDALEWGMPLVENDSATDKFLVRSLWFELYDKKCVPLLERALETDSAKQLNITRLFKTMPISVVEKEKLEALIMLQGPLDLFRSKLYTLKKTAEIAASFDLGEVLKEQLIAAWKVPLTKLWQEVKDTFAREKPEFLKAALKANPQNSTANVSKCIDTLDATFQGHLDNLDYFKDLVPNVINNQVLQSLKAYLDEFKYGREFEKQNFALINVHLQSNTVEKWTQTLSYPFGSMACDIGGGLGLFLGASVVTILEIAYALYQHGCCLTTNRKATRQAHELVAQK